MQANYEYYPGTPGHQYDDLSLGVSTAVDARYTQSKLLASRGNPFIEALPFPRSQEEVYTAYLKPIPYDRTATETMSPEEIEMNLDVLKELRFPLPFHHELEVTFYNILSASYRSRISKFNLTPTARISTNGQTSESYHQLLGNPASAANTGLALLGYSGCGKSSSLEILLSHYPQVIYHHDDHGGRYPQIVYLAVNCIPNSNFSALYSRIGEAIDRALNLDEPIYQKMVESKRSLGEKSSCIRKLIEIFSIGAIILDEIQLIDFNTTKENSFESLLLLTNETKVAFVVVGTEDAYSKMFKEPRTARRIGEIINGNAYCENHAYFSRMLKMLFRYQWFQKCVPPTSEIAEALYELSHGIIYFLIKSYIELHRAYYRETPPPEINAVFIRTRVQPRMKQLYCLLQDTIPHNPMHADADPALHVDEQHQEAFAQSYLDQCREADALRQNVYSNVASILGSTIEFKKVDAAYSRVIANPKQKLTERDLTGAVIKLLSRSKSNAPKKTMLTPISFEDMKKSLLDSAGKDTSPN